MSDGGPKAPRKGPPAGPGPEAATERVIARASESLFPNYRQHHLVLVRGKGGKVWDAEGREYSDFVAGIATCNLGHCHPAVTRAIRDQAGRLVHVSNWYFNQPQVELAERLRALTFADRVFFCNSGAEASEAAIKLARKRAFDEFGPGRETIVSLLGAFHGRTMKALTATDPKHHLPAFSPYPEGFVHVVPGDLPGLERVLPSAAALLLEPVQGEGGVRPLKPAYLMAAAELCRKTGALLLVDEVQTGMGRCGSLFAHQALGFLPDVMTLAKGLGNGFPIGAVLARSEVAAHMGPGTHGSTFGGNPLACAAALATLDTLVGKRLPQKAARAGAFFRKGLEAVRKRHPLCAEVRGMGLLLGLELTIPAAPAVQELLRRGYLVTAVKENTLRFTPPLTVGRAEIQGLLAALEESLDALKGTTP